MATAQVKASARAHLRITLWAMLIVSTNKHQVKIGLEHAQDRQLAALAPFFEVPRLKQVA